MSVSDRLRAALPIARTGTVTCHQCDGKGTLPYRGPLQRLWKVTDGRLYSDQLPDRPTVCDWCGTTVPVGRKAFGLSRLLDDRQHFTFCSNQCLNAALNAPGPPLLHEEATR